MTGEQLIAAVLECLAFPPGLNIGLFLLAFPLRHRRLGALLWALSLVTLYLASTPGGTFWLNDRIATIPPVSLSQSTAEAIVVLGADRYAAAPEFGGKDTIRGSALERVRYAAWLHKVTQLPILLSGGSVLDNGSSPESDLMAAVLSQEFGVEAQWREGKSRNTRENAEFSSQILKGAGLGEIMLVTHALHMRRSVEAFERAGIRVVPAPTGFVNAGSRDVGILRWLPNASALDSTRAALHELAGLWWYRWRPEPARP